MGSPDRWSDQGQKYRLFNWLIQKSSQFLLAEFFWSIKPLIADSMHAPHGKVRSFLIATWPHKLQTAKVYSKVYSKGIFEVKSENFCSTMSASIYETVKAALEKDDQQYLKELKLIWKNKSMTYRSVLLMNCWVLWIAIASFWHRILERNHTFWSMLKKRKSSAQP